MAKTAMGAREGGDDDQEQHEGEERVGPITSQEINVLIYCYLLESPFPHSAYTFRNEAQLDSAQYAHLRDPPDAQEKLGYEGLVPRGELIRCLQKGLLWSDAERHISESGEPLPCKAPFHLLKPHSCSLSTPLPGAFLSPSFSLDDSPPQRPAIFDAPVAGPSRSGLKPNGSVSRKGKGKEVAQDTASTSTSAAGTPRIKAKVMTQDNGDIEMADGQDTEVAPKKRQRPKAISSPDKAFEKRDDGANGSTKSKPKSLGGSNAASPVRPSDKPAKPKSSDRETESGDAPKKKRRVEDSQKERDREVKRKERDGSREKKSQGQSEASSSRKASAASDAPLPSKKSGKNKNLLEVKKERQEAAEQGVGVWREHTAGVVRVSWNPRNLEMLATGGQDATARIWDFDASASSNVLQLKEPPIVMRHLPIESRFRDVTGVHFHPDGMMLATCSLDSVARLYMSTGDLHIALTLHSGPINELKWNEAGTHLITASRDSTVCLWELAAELSNSKNRVLYTSHSQQVHDIDWLDNEIFASGSEDGDIYVHRITTTTPLRSFKGHTDEVFQIRWSPPRDGARASSRLLASASDDKTVRIWGFSDREASPSKEEADEITKMGNGKTASKYCKQVLTGHTKGVTLVDWSPYAGLDGCRMIVATASYDQTVRLYDAVTGECLHVLQGHVESVTALAFSPRGVGSGIGKLATGAEDGRVIIWDVESGNEVKRFETSEDVVIVSSPLLQAADDKNHMSWRADGEQLAVAAGDKTLRIIHVGGLL